MQTYLGCWTLTRWAREEEGMGLGLGKGKGRGRQQVAPGLLVLLARTS